MIRTISILVLVLSAIAYSATVHVPGDQPTIQAAVSFAQEGDTVLVAPGEYIENIVANAKGFALISQAGAAATTIRPADLGARTIYLAQNQNRTFILKGFTFTGSDAYACVEIYSGLARIYDNVFEDINSDAGALVLGHGGGTILNNVFRNNHSNEHGGAMQVASWKPMLIADNIVTGNTATYGAGINLLGARFAVVRNNLIIDNHATEYGGGIYLANNDAYRSIIHDNTIVNCTSGNDGGGGICFGGCPGDSAYNNIIVDCGGYGIWAANSFMCFFDYNCLSNNTPGDYQGVPTGPNELLVDPQFVGGIPSSYELLPTSPCFDAGNPDSRYFDLMGGRNDIGATFVGIPHIPTTIRVPLDQPTIQSAVYASRNGDTVLVAAGTYTENIHIVGRGITLISESGSALTTITPEVPSVRTLHVEDNTGLETALKGFTITGSDAFCAVEIFRGTGLVSDNIFADNQSDAGALVVGHGGGAITNNVFSNNIGSFHGGGMQVASWNTMLIADNTLYGNSATYGAAMNLLGASNATVRNNLLVDNHAISYGGGIYLANSDAVNTLIHDNTIVNCSSGNNGGGGICFGGSGLDTAYNNIIVGCQGNGIWAANSFESFFDYNCLFNNSPADYEGVPFGVNEIHLDPLFVGGDPFLYLIQPTSPCVDAGNPETRFNDTNGTRNDIGADLASIIVYIQPDTLRVPEDYATIQAAIDAASEGDIVLVAPGEYVENLFANGKGFSLISEAGAASTIIRPADPDLRTLYLPANVGHVFELAGFTFTGSDAYVSVESYSGISNVHDNIFEDNDVSGGALLLGHGGGSIVDNVFTNNRGTQHGGAMQVPSWQPMLIEGNTITGNTANWGAGINLLGGRYVTVRYNLIADNHATSYGGGIYLANDDAIHTVIHNNTIVNCSSGNNGGGGICFGGCTLDTAYNNIIVGCEGNGIWAANTWDCFFDYNCLFNNLPADYEGVPIGSGEIYVDPLFVGGLPFSFALTPTSPCIDAGNPDPMFNDLDGSRNDIGAFPFTTYTPGDVDGNGSVNVSDAVYVILYIFANGPVPVQPASGDVNCDGLSNISDVVYIINFVFLGGPAPCQK